jgi:tRNA(Ile)-lysidine synthase
MAARCVAVAYSGGRDSTALLHSTLQAAAREGMAVAALHVHHGLHPAADEWLRHAKSQCERWARQGLPVRLLHRRLAGKPARGESVEAWARKGRYRALAEMAREAGASLVLLAHHRTDQAETFLLQALRGAGMAGLSAMPQVAQRDGLTWARPWLDEPRTRIEAYVRRHRLAYIDDSSNADARFARNRLRSGVWPELLRAFPDAEASLAAAAIKAQQAQDLLDEIAASDLAQVQRQGALQREPWLQLSAPRRANALRAWLRGHGEITASLLERLLREWPDAKSGARWPLEHGEVRNYRGALRFAASAPEPTAPSRVGSITIKRAGRIALPEWGGALMVERVASGGVALARLAHCELRERSGGEQFQRAPRSTPRSLKKQYQAAGLAEWDRQGPLLYVDDSLVFVPGLGIDARHSAAAGEAQVTLTWEMLRRNS